MIVFKLERTLKPVPWLWEWLLGNLSSLPALTMLQQVFSTFSVISSRYCAFKLLAAHKSWDVVSELLQVVPLLLRAPHAAAAAAAALLVRAARAVGCRWHCPEKNKSVFCVSEVWSFCQQRLLRAAAIGRRAVLAWHWWQWCCSVLTGEEGHRQPSGTSRQPPLFSDSTASQVVGVGVPQSYCLQHRGAASRQWRKLFEGSYWYSLFFLLVPHLNPFFTFSHTCHKRGLSRGHYVQAACVWAWGKAKLGPGSGPWVQGRALGQASVHMWQVLEGPPWPPPCQGPRRNHHGQQVCRHSKGQAALLLVLEVSSLCFLLQRGDICVWGVWWAKGSGGSTETTQCLARAFLG